MGARQILRTRSVSQQAPQFPDATNTGPSGTLAAASGGVTLSTPGQVYENKHLTGYIVVSATNVTVRNCRLTSQSFWAIRCTSGSVTVVDCEIIGDPDGTGCIYANGGQIHVLRTNCHGAEDGIRMETSGCTVRDSYIHDLESATPAEAHYDGMNADGTTGWEITGNTILNPNPQTACVWIGDPRYSPSAGLLQGNLIGGGGYSIYAGPSTAPGLRVLGNQFTTRYYANSGSLNVCAAWEAAGNTWSGNVWADGPRAGQTVSP